MNKDDRWCAGSSLKQAAAFFARTGLISGLILLIALAVSARAHDAEKAAAEARLERGLAIAAENCSACHAIGPDDESPTRVNENTAFRQLHERYPIAMLVEAAKTGLISGHDEMPEFQFEPEDAEALLAYIDSLAPDKPGYTRQTP